MKDKDLIKKVSFSVIDEENTSWEMNIHRFDWVAGVELFGLCKANELLKSDEILAFLEKWTKIHKAEFTGKITINTAVLAQVVLYLYEKTNNAEYLEICKKVADYLISEAPLTREGALEHTVIEDVEFSEQVWADTLFMAVLFLAKMGEVDTKYKEFAKNQMICHLKCLKNTANGLYCHGWNSNRGDHMSAVCWGRANAWIIYSGAELINILGDFEGINEVRNAIKEHVEVLSKYQTEDGAFRTIIDDETSYEEASATAGIIAGIKLAVNLGIVEDKYESNFEKGIEYIKSQIDDNGILQSVSFGTPVMKSAEEYKNIALIPTLYGQGLGTIALCLE